MSWIQKLYKTYNNCEEMIGSGLEEGNVPLIPICHTTQKAHIEITIDEGGEFLEAGIVPKDESRTIIPCTEGSGGRTGSKIAPHPLCDKLQYVAGDYKKYGADIKYATLDGDIYRPRRSDNPKDYKGSYYEAYVKRLSNWLKFIQNEKVLAVQKYIKKGTVIADLVAFGILVTDENNQLIPKRRNKKGKNAPKDIFDILPGSINSQGRITTWQADAFIRWRVEIPGDAHTSVWDDSQIYQDWIDFYTSTKETKSLCYVTGENAPTTEQHPAKIQSDGDKAKLISSNDWNGYTFRGRFTDTKKNNSYQTCSVSFKVTQKAHSALRWLIGRQGYTDDGFAIVAWATSGEEIPQLFDDVDIADTQQDLAINLRKKIAGYDKKIDPDTDVVVMGLNSATPGKGRMAITYYRELKSSDFLKRLNRWHETCSWHHRYRFIDKKRIPFDGAPAPKDIAEAVYGTNEDGKFVVKKALRKKTIERILPCIIDGYPIPSDLVKSAVRKASNPIALEDWQWKKTLSVACALYKKFIEKEDYPMALDETRTSRDYLYGRLLAIADRLEEHALYDPSDPKKKTRATNATRYMQQFSQHPYRTWAQLHSALIPYMVRLDGAFFYKNMITEVQSLFDPDDFMSDKPLSGEYLLGYYSQRQKLWQKNKKEDEGKQLDE